VPLENESESEISTGSLLLLLYREEGLLVYLRTFFES
jgi:hypothetical protein